MKTAVISGVSGQDGSYMADLLVMRGYKVVGIIRPGSSLKNLSTLIDKIELISTDILDKKFIFSVVEKYKPDEIYNFAAISNINHPWNDFSLTVELNALVPVQFLEAITIYSPSTRFFQASSSQMFGRKLSGPQDINTSFEPANIYSYAKLFAHQMLDKVRKDKKVFAVSGILFNHESPRRGSEFITKKIVSEFVKIKKGQQDVFLAGFLDAKRDWGFAPEFIEGIWSALQKNDPRDYIFATGVQHSIREFITETASCLDIKICWEGSGVDEVGKDQNGKIVVRVNKDFYFDDPTNVFGDISETRNTLGWEPKTDFKQIIDLMVNAEYNK